MNPLEPALGYVQELIVSAAQKAHRDSREILLVVASKYVGVQEIAQAYDLGLCHFGENRVQDAWIKAEELSEKPDFKGHWHMIGHLQKNKVRRAVQLFECIHSVDSWELALQIDKQAQKQSKHLDILLQVNVSGEQSKQGFTSEDLFASLDQAAHLQAVRIVGLMTMAPHFDNAEQARPVFRSLRCLKDKILEQGLEPWQGLKHLSMGMSADFEVAIEEGATIVRLGSVLLKRQKD